MEGYTPIILIDNWRNEFIGLKVRMIYYSNWIHPIFTEFNIN